MFYRFVSFLLLSSIMVFVSDFCSGNLGMLCKSVLESIERGGFHFVDPDKTFCLSNQTFNWFNSTDRIPITQLERMRQLQQECPENCKCEAEQMNYEGTGGNRLVFYAKVDCSNAGLTELPYKLPSNMLTLNISNNKVNQITDKIAFHSFTNITFFFRSQVFVHCRKIRDFRI